jgi:hypothetical protein
MIDEISWALRHIAHTNNENGEFKIAKAKLRF